MAGAQPEEHVGRAAVGQAWRQVSFLHWPVDPALLAARLPAPLEPDLVDGRAWVGLTPFRVDELRLAGVRVPGVPPYAETNLRTYVRHPDGKDGLWFFSLDVGSPVDAAAGRTVAPYFLGAMAVEVDGPGDRVTYRARRRIGPAAHHTVVVAPGADLDEGTRPLATALTGRWRAYGRLLGRLVEVPVAHEPWPLRSGSLVHLDETILAATGLSVTGEPLVHWSPGVDARIGRPRRPTGR